MRLLRLDFQDDLTKYELHPLLTVLHGTPVERQHRLVKAIRKLGDGSVSSLAGLLEHDGLLIQLDGISAPELPTFGTTKEVVAYFGSDQNPAEGGLLAAELAAVERKLEIAAVRLEELRADFDPSVKAELYSARQRLGIARGDKSALAELSASQRRLTQVQRHYNEAVALPSTLLHTPDGVPELIAEIEELEIQRKDLDRRLEQQYQEIARLANSYQEARDLLLEAEANAKPVLLDKKEEKRLEILADPSTDLSRKGKWRNQLNDSETQELEELLQKVGVESATEYWLFRLNPTAPKEKRDAVVDARAHLETLGNRLKVEKARLEANSEVAAIKAKDIELLNRAKGYLGIASRDALVEALQALSTEVPNPAWTDKVEELSVVLTRNELEPPADLQPEEVVEWTDSWLRGEAGLADDEAEEVDEEELEAQVAECERRFAKHSRALGMIPAAEASYEDAQEEATNLMEALSKNVTEGSQELDREELEETIYAMAGAISQGTQASVPLVVVSNFAGVADDEIGLLAESLSTLSDQLQLVIITERRDLLDWVENAGLERASAVTEKEKVRA